MELEWEEKGPRIKILLLPPQREAGKREERVKLQGDVNKKKMLYWTVLEEGTQARKLSWSQWVKR